MDSIPYSEKLYPKLIDHLIRVSEFAIKPPVYGSVEVKPPNSVKGLTVWDQCYLRVSHNFITRFKTPPVLINTGSFASESHWILGVWCNKLGVLIVWKSIWMGFFTNSFIFQLTIIWSPTDTDTNFLVRRHLISLADVCCSRGTSPRIWRNLRRSVWKWPLKSTVKCRICRRF